MFIKILGVQSYWIDSVLRLNEHGTLDACKTVTRVSVPFTEGHYCGVEERQNTELAHNGPFTGRQQDTENTDE